MVKPVNGFFCCVCKKFFASKLSEHCESSNHYSRFVECVESKKQKLRKRKLEETDFSTVFEFFLYLIAPLILLYFIGTRR